MCEEREPEFVSMFVCAELVPVSYVHAMLKCGLFATDEDQIRGIWLEGSYHVINRDPPWWDQPSSYREYLAKVHPEAVQKTLYIPKAGYGEIIARLINAYDGLAGAN